MSLFALGVLIVAVVAVVAVYVNSASGRLGSDRLDLAVMWGLTMVWLGLLVGVGIGLMHLSGVVFRWLR